MLLVIIIAGSYFWVSKSNTTSNQYQTAKVAQKDLALQVSASGVLTGKLSVSLKFRSAGKLAYLNVKTGDLVYAGQVIAGLDVQDLNIALQQAQNSFRDKQAAVDKAIDEVKNHSADESFTQKQTRTSAEVARDNAYDSVKAAQRAFTDMVIVSPISGTVVAQSDLVSGQNVSSSDLIATVVDFSDLQFSADVDETDINKINLSQKAEVSLNAYPDQIFTGSVGQILSQTKTSSNGATTINVRINLDSKDIKSINGLNGSVNIIESQVKGVLAIPQGSLGSGDTVLLKSGNRYLPVKVIPGLKTDSDIEVKSGLNAGDEVVTNPPQTLGQNSPNRARTDNPILRFFRFGPR